MITGEEMTTSHEEMTTSHEEKNTRTVGRRWVGAPGGGGGGGSDASSDFGIRRG